MATMTMTNGEATIKLTIDELRELFGTTANVVKIPIAAPKAAKPTAKPTAKPAKRKGYKPTHNKELDSNRVQAMVKRAQTALAKAGFETKATPQGSWYWIYPCGKSTSKGRTDEFKQVKLAKGWNYSAKRGAFYRDFS